MLIFVSNSSHSFPERGHNCVKTATQCIAAILQKGRQSLPKIFGSNGVRPNYRKEVRS
jgi:hypothetical protein